MIREVRLLGDPVLRKKTREVEAFDEELAELLDDMAETMYHYEGIGLAAPQIGIDLRVTVLDVTQERDGSGLIELVNPRIVESSGTIPSEEGCLSIPGVVETIERAAEVEVEHLDRSGEPATIAGSELFGRAVQHEIDHLEGVLFIDYLGALKRKLVVRQFKKALEEQASTER